MTFLIINAVAWIWVSYYLAIKGMTQIASSLSETALRTILGTVIAYAVKSTTENISKNGFVGKQDHLPYFSSTLTSTSEEHQPDEKGGEDYHEI